MRQRFDPTTAGERHGCPVVLACAPHRWPFQSGPKSQPATLVRVVTWGRARLFSGLPPRGLRLDGGAEPGSL